ncbi:MAG: hypothetical protein RIS76_1173, partial [Verrucomicrobiota bacterium]
NVAGGHPVVIRGNGVDRIYPNNIERRGFLELVSELPERKSVGSDL